MCMMVHVEHLSQQLCIIVYCVPHVLLQPKILSFNTCVGSLIQYMSWIHANFGLKCSVVYASIGCMIIGY